MFTSLFILSLSLILFVDNFDVHRNMYCTLKAFYWISVNLSYEEWCKVTNIFTLSLKSHKTDIREIIKVFIKNINKLNIRYEMKINENTVTVIVFFIILIEDMSQQADNREFLRHSVNIDCWTCFCSKKSQHNLFFNIVSQECYHWKTIRQRQ